MGSRTFSLKHRKWSNVQFRTWKQVLLCRRLSVKVQARKRRWRERGPAAHQVVLLNVYSPKWELYERERQAGQVKCRVSILLLRMRVVYARRLNLDVYVVFADNPDYLEHLAGLAGSDSGEEDDIGKARSRSQSSSPARPRRGQKYNDEHTLERKYSKCRAVHMMSFLLLVLHVFVTSIC